jgi:nicotinic acid mononucleotide adenylyltransferase
MAYCFRLNRGKVELTQLSSSQCENIPSLKKIDSNIADLYVDLKDAVKGHSWTYWREAYDLMGKDFNPLIAALMWSPLSVGSDLELPKTSEITIYGGSFNPFHQGHKACLDLCPSKNILLVPTLNPYKESRPKNLAKLFLDLSLNYLTYPGELTINRSPYVVDWLPEWSGRYLVNFLMGDDTFVSLSTWLKYKDVLGMFKKIYVVERNQSKELIVEKIDYYQSINPSLEVEILYGNNYSHLSSSQLR